MWLMEVPISIMECCNLSLQVPVLVNRGWVPGSWRDDPSVRKQDEQMETSAKPASPNVQNTGFLTTLFGKKTETMEVRLTVCFMKFKQMYIYP